MPRSRSLGLVWQLARAVYQERPRLVVWSLLLSLASAFTGGVGVLLLIPLLNLVGIGQAGDSEASRQVYRLWEGLGPSPTLLGVLVVFCLALTAQAWLQRTQTLATNQLALEFPFLVQKDLYQAIARTRWAHFLTLRKSRLLQACTGEIQRLESAVFTLHSLVLESCLCLGYGLVALLLMPAVTLVWVACGLLLLLLIRRRIRRARQVGEQISEDSGHLYQTISEHLDAFQVARSYQAQERHVEQFLADLRQYSGTLSQGYQNYVDSRFGFRVASVLVLCLVCYGSVAWVKASPTTVMVCIFVFSRLVPNLSSLEQLLQSFLHAAPAYESIQETIQRCHQEAEPRIDGEFFPLPFERELRLEGVSFSYPGTERAQVDNLSLSIKAGQTTALVGPSGCGKSTTVDLILGLLTPHAGRILVDEVPLTAQLLPGWRQTVAYVPQDTFLFHDTVRANLLWAFPGASESELWSALRDADAEEFVGQMPAGLDTVIGDRGARLSGGQAQRLSLARALLRRPRLLILDEATSALDEASESRILLGLRQRPELTILMITHRLATANTAASSLVQLDPTLIPPGTLEMESLRISYPGIPCRQTTERHGKV